MGLFSSPPPTSVEGFTDLKVPDFEQLGYQLGAGASKGLDLDPVIVKLWHYFKEFALEFIGGVVNLVDFVAAFFLQAITQAQGVGQPGMVALMAGVLGDLLGLEFDADELVRTMTKGGRLATMTKAGGWLFDKLRGEFTGGTTPGNMAASDVPAKTFLGFLIEFAVREGNLAYLSEFIPEEFNFFVGLREYGELLARNLGLGRLARRALQPLVQIMIADPLQWQLNQLYRPKLLSEGQAVKAFNRGVMTRAELNRILAYQGYTDAAIEMVITDNQHAWHARELIELVRLQKIDELEAADRLTQVGVDDSTAAQLWDAYAGEARQNVIHEYISEVLRQVRDGFLPNSSSDPGVTSAQDLLAALPLLGGELEQWKHVFGQLVEYPRKHLSESEMERAFLGGLIDMTTIQDYWVRLGYFPDSIQVLTLLLLEKLASGHKTKSGHTPHKILSEAQAEKAFHAGIINLAQIQSYWHAMGYSPDDVLVLTALVELKTAPPGTTTLPAVTTP